MFALRVNERIDFKFNIFDMYVHEANKTHMYLHMCARCAFADVLRYPFI